MATVIAFTLRDLNRQPAKVLAAVRKFGVAEVRTRSGEIFTLTPKAGPGVGRSAGGIPDFAALWKRQREAGLVPPGATEEERINRLVAGEE